MPRTAIVLYLAFLVVGVGWRSWRQWKRTGDSGFRGFARNATATERVAGGLFTLAALALLVGPISMLQHRTSPLLDVDDPWLRALGIAFGVTGFGVTLRAQLQMGASWRIGVDPDESTTLVQHGLFARIRNPIFTGMLVGGLGIVCLAPNAVSLAAWIALLIGIELQVRGVEEPYLLKTHGDAYRSYARRAGRFLPSLGRLEK